MFEKYLVFEVWSKNLQRNQSAQFEPLPLPSPPSPLKGGGRIFKKLSHIGERGGYAIFCQKGGINLKWGGCNFFITLQFNHIYCVCGESKVLFITFRIFSPAMQDSHPSLYYTKTWYHLYISDPFWQSAKMLTALFNSVNGQFFLSAQARCFLVLKRFQKR